MMWNFAECKIRAQGTIYCRCRKCGGPPQLDSMQAEPSRVECTVQLKNYLKENFEISFKIQHFVVIILLLHLN